MPPLPDPHDIPHAMAKIPSGRFILTCAHEGYRNGVLIHWVQRCADDPPMVMVGLPCGLPVEPLIRSSRAFALCQIAEDDVFLARKFATPPANGDDPFDAVKTFVGRSGSPIITRAMAYLDCELVRHVELDADSRLYVGRVHDGAVLKDSAAPAVRFGADGCGGPSTDRHAG